jgi:hypothetical protein
MKKARKRPYNPNSAYHKARMLRSGYTDGQTYDALEKAWIGYQASKREGIMKRMVYYAAVIQKLQKELGLPISNFPNLAMSAIGEKGSNARHLFNELYD